MTYSQGFLPSDLLISPTQLAQTLGKRIDDFWSVDPTGCSAAVGAPTVLFCVAERRDGRDGRKHRLL